MEQIGRRWRISEGSFLLNFTSRKVRNDDVCREPRVNRRLYRAHSYGNRLLVDGGPIYWWFLLSGFVLSLLSTLAFFSKILHRLLVFSFWWWCLVLQSLGLSFFIYVNRQLRADGRSFFFGQRVGFSPLRGSNIFVNIFLFYLYIIE